MVAGRGRRHLRLDYGRARADGQGCRGRRHACTGRNRRSAAIRRRHRRPDQRTTNQRLTHPLAAHPPRPASPTAGIGSNMAAFDIFTLRPAGTSAKSIREALDRATQADAAQAENLRQARAARDGLLLDGTPAELKQADARVADASAAAERVETIKAQLTARLAAAEEAEFMAELEAARLGAEKAMQAHARWWSEKRGALARELSAGLALKQQEANAHQDFQRLMSRAAQRFPDRPLAPAVPPPDQAWALDLPRARLRRARRFQWPCARLRVAGAQRRFQCVTVGGAAPLWPCG